MEFMGGSGEYETCVTSERPRQRRQVAVPCPQMRVPRLASANLHRAGFVAWLAAVGIEDAEGEEVDAAVVHGEEDLAWSDGRGVPHDGGDAAAAGGDAGGGRIAQA